VNKKDLDRLRELQKILSRKIQLEQAILEIPKQLVNLEEAHNRTRKSFIEKNADYEKLKASEEETRALLREAEAAREKAERTISEINTQREYEALDKERLTAEEKEQQYSRDLQNKERQLTDMNAEITQQADLIEQLGKDLEERRAVVDSEVAERTAEAEALHAEELRLADDLDKEVVFKFERILRNKSGLGIVAIKRNVCMGCYMILPAQFSNNVRVGEEFVFCPYCSRILFYEETQDGEEFYFDPGDSGALYEEEEEEEDLEEAEVEKSVDFDE